jgi:hypothetical protein
LDVGPWIVAVDRPERWADMSASHHGQHAAGGAAIGAASYLASVGLDDRGKRYAVAIAAGVTAGVGFELWEGRRGTSYADPIDAAYVAMGAAAGALAADLTGRTLSVALTPTSAAVGIAWRF